MGRKSGELTTETKEIIVTLSESVTNKAALPTDVKTVEHCKNDHLKNYKHLSKGWLGREFEAKWKEKEVHRDKKYFKSSG